LCGSKELCDVIFQLGEEQFHAHQVFISEGSVVLYEMIEKYKQQCNNKEIIIEIADLSPAVFKQLLMFMYIGKVESRFSKELLAISKKVGGEQVLFEFDLFRTVCYAPTEGGV